MGDFSTITPKAGNDSLGSWRYCWQLVGGKKKQKKETTTLKELCKTLHSILMVSWTTCQTEYLPYGGV